MFRNTVTFLCIFIISIFALSCEPIPREIERTEGPGLSDYTRLDLRTAGSVKLRTLSRKFEKLSGKEINPVKYKVRPWWVSKYRNGKVRWVLFEGYEGLNSTSDESCARIHCFDDNWKYLYSSDAFRTGHANSLHEAIILPEPTLGTDVLIIHTFYIYQWYAIFDDHIALIRMEDKERNVVRNSYCKEPSEGPNIPDRTAEQWKQSLDSENPCEVLETLVWLSGCHFPSNIERRPNLSQESVEDARLFESVINSPEVQQKLSRLSNSPNVWIKQAAEMALNKCEKFGR